MPQTSRPSRPGPRRSAAVSGILGLVLTLVPAPAGAQPLPLDGAVRVAWPKALSAAPSAGEVPQPSSPTYDRNGFDRRGYGRKGTDLFPYPVPDFVHSYHGWIGIEVDGIHYGIGDEIPPYRVRLERIGYRTLAFRYRGRTYIRPLIRP